MEVTQLVDRLVGLLDELGAAADPELVQAELDDAAHRAERIRFETGEEVKEARKERAESMALLRDQAAQLAEVYGAEIGRLTRQVESLTQRTAG
jgi:predicted Zn-dependent peptidase